MILTIVVLILSVFAGTASSAIPPHGNRLISAPLVSPTEAQLVRDKMIDSRVQQFGRDRVPIEITPEIQALARGLRYDPRLIYEFVRNTIDYVPMYGSLKGATMTLLDGEAGDFDQVSLLIALMRESGYTSSYIYGTIELTGAEVTSWLGIPDNAAVLESMMGDGGIPGIVTPAGESIASVVMDHVWAKVTINSVDYVFDPSYKSRTVISGIDLATAMGYDKATFLAHATQGMTTNPDYIQNLNQTNIQSDLMVLSSNLKLYIETNLPDSALQTIIGGDQIQPEQGQSFQTVLPYEVTRDQEFSDIPVEFETMVYIHHYIYSYFAVSEIYGKRLCILFDHCVGCDPREYLLLDGIVVDDRYNYMLYPLSVDIDHPYSAYGGTYGDVQHQFELDQYTNEGDYNLYYFSQGWGFTGRKILEKHRRVMGQLVADGASPDLEPLLGETLAMIGLSWMAENSLQADMGDQLTNTTSILHHSFGVVGHDAAIYMDMPLNFLSVISLDNDENEQATRFNVHSAMASALEWGTIDQMQPQSAVSTIKLLDTAAARGDKVFDADSSNYSTDVRPNLVNYTETQLDHFQEFVDNGNRLILHEDRNVVDGSFTGYGFYSLDPFGGIATMINGGLSGGYSTESGYEVTSCLTGQKEFINYQEHPLTDEPVDMLTGYYLDEKLDLTVGSSSMPFGLGFSRYYNSGDRFNNGPLGPGWKHNLDITAVTGSDGFRGFGSMCSVDAATALATLYVTTDVLRDGLLLDRLLISNAAHRWLTDHLIDNVVNINSSGGVTQFNKLPDGSFYPPPKNWAQLNLEPDSSFLMTTKYGIQLDFDGDGNLQTWQDPNGNTVTFSYTGNKLSTVSNEFGKSLTLQYNPDDRIETVMDSAGRSVTFTYDPAGHLETVTDPLSNTTTYEYDVTGRMTHRYLPSDPVNPFMVNTYDDFDRVVAQSDFSGNPYLYYYAFNRQTEEELPSGFSRSWYYDLHGNCVSYKDPLEYSTHFEYDGLNRLIRIRYPEGNGHTFEYDSLANLTRTTLFPKTGSMEPELSTSFSYHPVYNKMVQATDSLNRITDWTYDTEGNLIKLELPVVNAGRPTFDFTISSFGKVEVIDGPEGSRRAFSYDPDTAEILTETLDPNGYNLTSQYLYDPVGNVTDTIQPLGNTWTMEYNNNRRLIQTIAPAPLNYETHFDYDVNGNLIETRRETGLIPDPWQIHSAAYNLGGALIETTDPGLQVTQYRSTDRQSLWKVVYPGNPTDEFGYDELDRPYQRIDPLGHVVEQRSYTPNGKLMTLIDANANDTRYEYDDYDRLKKEIFKDNSFRQFSYDSVGNITEILTREGDVISYSYDELNRLITKTLPGPSVITYNYDALGRLTSMIDATGTTAFDYDTAGRIETVTDPETRTIGYTYDDNSNLQRLTYPDGYYLDYSYDELNRLESIIEDGTTLLVQYSYDPLSRRVTMSYGNGIMTAYSHTLENNLEEISTAFADGIVDFSYTYNARGHVTDQDVSHGEFLFQPADYYALSYNVNELNQYIEIEGQTNTFDTNGNLTSDGLCSYVFSPENRLTTVTSASNTVSYSYDGLGRRIEKNVNGTETGFVYNGTELIAEYDTNGSLTRRYIFGPGLDQPVMMKTGANQYYYHQDHLNSVVALSNSAGNRVETYAYSSFGEPSQVSGLGNPFMYTGREYESETGLSYLRERYYSPVQGRFISVDPIGFQGGDLNLYSYARNSPLNYIDPFGLSPENKPRFNYKTFKTGAWQIFTGTLAVGGTVIIEVGSGGTLTPVAVVSGSYAAYELGSGAGNVINSVMQPEFEAVPSSPAEAIGYATGNSKIQYAGQVIDDGVSLIFAPTQTATTTAGKVIETVASPVNTYEDVSDYYGYYQDVKGPASELFYNEYDHFEYERNQAPQGFQLPYDDYYHPPEVIGPDNVAQPPSGVYVND